MSLPGLRAWGDRALKKEDVRGREVARRLLLGLTGSYDLGLLPDEPSGRPAPMLHSFLGRLMDTGVLSSEHREVIAAILNWYEAFWAQYELLCRRPDWRAAVVDSVRDYAKGNRTASFRPYYEPLTIDPSLFAAWAEELTADELPAHLHASSSWRGPVGLMKTFVDLASFRSGPAPAEPWHRLDLHTCGSPSSLLLGDSGYQGFEASLVWCCPGTADTVCGEISVDVWD